MRYRNSDGYATASEYRSYWRGQWAKYQLEWDNQPTLWRAAKQVYWDRFYCPISGSYAPSEGL